MTPAFSIANLAWLERGGVYAVANLRGGGEYGESLAPGGDEAQEAERVRRLHRGRRVADREQDHEPAKRLAIEGGSNGGLLVGAVPEPAARPLRGRDPRGRGHGHAALPQVHDRLGLGQRLRLVRRPDEFKALRAYSPYHNLKKGACYPPTLVTTADHDDRVFPAHSFKFAAALQDAQGCDKPVLIRIETRAGHGAGKPTAKIIEEAADVWAFLLRALGVD